ncbi:TonB-dependent receptor [Sphingomonas oryzagri]
MFAGLGRAVLLSTAAFIFFLPAGAQAQVVETSSEAITVNGILPSADRTYRVDTVKVGPLGDKALVDTPYSITVVPVNLAENQQLQNVRELFRYIPSVQGENIRPQTRGLQAGVVQNTRIDGLNIAATTDYAIEQFDRIEVLNGLSGALYGPASPAGTFNYVFKRPTAKPVYAVTLGYASDASFIEHADIGGRFGKDGMFGLRVNLLNQSGQSYADGSDLRRRLAAIAFDLHASPSTVIETNFSTYHYVGTGFPGTFSLAKGVLFPENLDPSRKGYGYAWAGDNNVTHIFSGRVKQDIGADWHLSAGALYMTNDRASTVPTLTITDNAGDYTATTVTTTFSLDKVLSNTANLNGHVEIAGITNDLMLGTTGFTWKRYTPFKTGAITLGKGNLADPTLFTQPSLPDFKDRFHAQSTTQQSISFGDTIGFTDRLSVLVAASQSWIHARNINKTGAITSRYNDDGLSPTASLLFKPRANMTAYVTYADSLQQGDAAPTGAANAGEALAPYRSREWEVGYKVALAKMNLGVALYRITRPYAFVGPDNVFREQGHQRNRGVELTANGKLTRDLDIFAGVSYLDPKLFETGSVATSDKQILGLAKFTFDVLLDYHVPFVPGLTLGANMNHASRRPGNYTNTDFVDGYTYADLDMRYQMNVAGRPVALRIAVNNVANARYWANIAPVGQNGYNSTDNGTGTLGAPRTVRASIEVGL